MEAGERETGERSGRKGGMKAMVEGWEWRLKMMAELSEAGDAGKCSFRQVGR